MLKLSYTAKWFKTGEVEHLDTKLVAKLDVAREIAGIPFVITSGFRSKEKNKAVGGVANSSHLTGLAVDLRSRTPYEALFVIKGLIKAGFERIVYEGDHIHADIDDSKPRGFFIKL